MTLVATVVLLSALNAQMRVESIRAKAEAPSLGGEVRIESIRAKLEVVPEISAGAR